MAPPSAEPHCKLWKVRGSPRDPRLCGALRFVCRPLLTGGQTAVLRLSPSLTLDWPPSPSGHWFWGDGVRGMCVYKAPPTPREEMGHARVRRGWHQRVTVFSPKLHSGQVLRGPVTGVRRAG